MQWCWEVDYNNYNLWGRRGKYLIYEPTLACMADDTAPVADSEEKLYRPVILFFACLGEHEVLQL